MVLVGAAFDVDWEEAGLPFEGGGLPGISAGGRAAGRAPEKIDKEEELGATQNEGGPGDAALHGKERDKRGGAAGDLGVVTRRASQAFHMHGKESAIRGYQREPEVPAAKAL